MLNAIQTYLKPHLKDAKALSIQEKCEQQFHIQTGQVLVSKWYDVDYEMSAETLDDFANQCLRNEISKEVLNQYFFLIAPSINL
jgi:hypothetical protein